MSDESKPATPDELEALKTLAAMQAHEIERLRRDLDEAHRVLTRLAAAQLGMVG
jgi:hypothetical protein